MIKSIINKFRDLRILVLGDVVLDNYVYGDVDRINPEAPVPVLRVTREENKLGGTSNVAANIRSLGGSCILIGQIGVDEAGRRMRALIDKAGIESYLIERGDFRTIVKTRIVARHQQVIRVDHEDPKPLKDIHVSSIIDYIKNAKFDLIVVSDYAKGVINAKLMDFIKSLNVKIIVDPKPSNAQLYEGVHIITPNLRESLEICNDADLTKRGSSISRQMHCNVVITRGEDGATLFALNGESEHIPAKRREVYDVVGAGDTFVAALALAVSSGASLAEACSIANLASGLVIEKVGTSVVTPAEILGAMGERDNNKLKDASEIRGIVEELRRKGSKIVFTNGCFDILHTGHARMLKEARSHGDILILGLNTDASVRTIKGLTRPINNEIDRAEMLSHLPYVNYIVLFNDPTPCDLISEIKPDVHVKGGDYCVTDYDKMPEAKIVHSYGGKVVTVGFVEGKSTTRNIEMLTGLCLDKK